MKIIFIGGPPIIGKTSFVVKLATKIKCTKIISTDNIRNTLSLTSEFENHMLSLSLYKDNFISFFLNQCNYINENIIKLINKLESYNGTIIIEGVHLLPNLYHNCIPDSFYFLMNTNDSLLYNRLLAKRLKKRYNQFNIEDRNQNYKLIYNYYTQLYERNKSINNLSPDLPFKINIKIIQNVIAQN